MVYEKIPIKLGPVFHPLYNPTNQGPFFMDLRLLRYHTWDPPEIPTSPLKASERIFWDTSSPTVLFFGNDKNIRDIYKVGPLPVINGVITPVTHL